MWKTEQFTLWPNLGLTWFYRIIQTNFRTLNYIHLVCDVVSECGSWKKLQLNSEFPLILDFKKKNYFVFLKYWLRSDVFQHWNQCTTHYKSSHYKSTTNKPNEFFVWFFHWVWIILMVLCFEPVVIKILQPNGNCPSSYVPKWNKQ